MPSKSLEFNMPPKTPIGSVINSLSEEAHNIAVQHGFYEDYDNLSDYLAVNDQPKKQDVCERDFILSQLAKISCEVGEAVDAIQHGEYLQLREELADVIIRTLDLAGFMDFRIGDCVLLKMQKNKNRPYKHGKVC